MNTEQCEHQWRGDKSFGKRICARCGNYEGEGHTEQKIEADPDYLRWIYFNLKAVQMKQDICTLLGLDAGIAFNKRKQHYFNRERK